MAEAIVTMPPYAPFMAEVARHPSVSGIRLNTVMPVKEPLEDVLRRMEDHCRGKPLWIDLKGRQLRTVGYAVAPFTSVEISHAIHVKTPTSAYFGNGRESVTLVGAEGKKLLFLEGPQRVIGPGESINIPHKSLEIEGTLTETDHQYVEAAKKIGLHHYMLSFVESEKDVEELQALDPAAIILSKIESQKGLAYVQKDFHGGHHLMAARGDLYIEVQRPHHILEALESIIAMDPEAVVASRLCTSMQNSAEPLCSDITDIGYLLKIGYTRFMFGDEVCLRKESIAACLNLFEALVT